MGGHAVLEIRERMVKEKTHCLLSGSLDKER